VGKQKNTEKKKFTIRVLSPNGDVKADTEPAATAAAVKADPPDRR
jgi:hypothetical protein